MRAELIARQQYAVGLTDYTNVYNAQGSLYSIQDQLTQVDSALATDVVALFKALGGGWEDEQAPSGAVIPAGAQRRAGTQE